LRKPFLADQLSRDSRRDPDRSSLALLWPPPFLTADLHWEDRNLEDLLGRSASFLMLNVPTLAYWTAPIKRASSYASMAAVRCGFFLLMGDPFGIDQRPFFRVVTSKIRRPDCRIRKGNAAYCFFPINVIQLRFLKTGRKA
jgi:hypothetical protein